MLFRTPVEIPDFSFRIEPRAVGLALGSCFAEQVGGWLARHKFAVEVNPFGALYNPASMARAVERLEAGLPFERADLFYHNGLWHSPLHHGLFSDPDPDRALERMNARLLAGAAALQRADYLLLTLGTAWVYEQQGAVVANCHRLPAETFRRRRLGVEECVDLLEPILRRHPHKQFLITVSPVIHRGDGLIENQRSKSTLLLAAAALTERRPNAHYFPAYEILTSELRDYRFWDDDLCHPAPLAVEYLRERFSHALFTPQTRQFVDEVAHILRAAEHRPLHPETEMYQIFLRSMSEKVALLQQTYPAMDWREELALFSR